MFIQAIFIQPHSHRKKIFRRHTIGLFVFEKKILFICRKSIDKEKAIYRKRIQYRYNRGFDQIFFCKIPQENSDISIAMVFSFLRTMNTILIIVED